MGKNPERENGNGFSNYSATRVRQPPGGPVNVQRSQKYKTQDPEHEGKSF